MPAPNSPPYGIFQPRVLNRWLDVNSQNGPLTRCQTYLTIPSFAIDINWLGYSDIVQRFCYTSPNNFSLLRVKGFYVPSNLPFLLCISWVDSEGITWRYALNSNPSAVIYFNLPAYTNQKIGTNFNIEIWSCNAPADLSNEIILYTSVTQAIDYRYGDDIELGFQSTCPVLTPIVFGIPNGLAYGNPAAGIGFGNPDAGIGFGQPA